MIQYYRYDNNSGANLGENDPRELLVVKFVSLNVYAQHCIVHSFLNILMIQRKMSKLFFYIVKKGKSYLLVV